MHLLIDSDSLGPLYKGPGGYLCYGNNLYVHRKVMETFLGRKLSSTEVVHHEDEDKMNADISNLRLFVSQSEHMTYHARQRTIKAGFDPDQYKFCNYHKKYEHVVFFSPAPSKYMGIAGSCRAGTNERRKGKGYSMWDEARAELQRIRRRNAKELKCTC